MTEKQLRQKEKNHEQSSGDNPNQALWHKLERLWRLGKPMYVTPEDRRAHKRELQRTYRARKRKEAAKK